MFHRKSFVFWPNHQTPAYEELLAHRLGTREHLPATLPTSVLRPRSWSDMASYDVASTICATLRIGTTQTDKGDCPTTPVKMNSIRISKQ